MTAFLEVRNLDVSFVLPRSISSILLRNKAPGLDVLQNVSLTLGKGETLGLVGESGSGKTTLARTITGLIPPQSGTISLGGRVVSGNKDKAFHWLRREISMMFQDPIASLSPRMRIGSLITEPFIINDISIGNRWEKAEELLDMVGLPTEFANRYPHELSGGQARRVGVARALALLPKIVIADEPTAGLDVSVQGEILNLMTRLQEELDLSYIIVTHNLAVVRHTTTQLAIMYLGQIVEQGPTDDIFERPSHPYTKALLDSEPHPDPAKRRDDLQIKGEIPSLFLRPTGCDFHTRCSFAQDKCRAVEPDFMTTEDGRLLRCHFPLQDTDG
ncbi:ABC transporter ATP-binding protein [Kiloniella laminariae]|uniref:ABC transporter ATP-binding protein n=1 Tax=Kiloniella laminariae TaxID=454162 RepID=A0ABT4LQ93_9PROT|nr:ABC transporter ATP-binding protein [Kiloniella laminariae]MCZ4283065.1 ABC transporter ATP-binding protein [Kiloniella laminariae]